MIDSLIEGKVSVAAEFKRLFGEGAERIKEACELYVKAIDEDNEAIEVFRKICPEISESMWASFELVGRRMMHERLLYMNGRAANTLRRLPISKQRDAIENGVEIITANNDCLRVKVEYMTPVQAKLALAKDHIRDIPEQRAFLESDKLKRFKPQKVTIGYEIKGRKIITYGPMELDKDDLRRMIKDLAK